MWMMRALVAGAEFVGVAAAAAALTYVLGVAFGVGV